MKSAATLALLSLLAVTVPVLAETSDERSACTPDVWRLCASEIPNVGAIKVCLGRQRTSLSDACRTVMDGSARPVRTVADRK